MSELDSYAELETCLAEVNRLRADLATANETISGQLEDMRLLADAVNRSSLALDATRADLADAQRVIAETDRILAAQWENNPPGTEGYCPAVADALDALSAGGGGTDEGDSGE